MPDGKWVSKANLQTFWQSIRSKLAPIITEEVNNVLPTAVGDNVTAWLTEHVDPVGSAVVVDDTLTIAGAAADAKKTGDEISGLKEDFNGNIKRANLSDTYQSDQINVLTSSDDLNDCLVPNVYRASVGTLHAPTNNMNYHVIVFMSKWISNTRKAITQIAISSANTQTMYVRTATVNASNVMSWDNSGNWTLINFDISQIGNNTITRNMLSDFYEGHLATMSSGSDLNTVTTPCNVLVNAGVSNSPDTVRRWLVFTQSVPWSTEKRPRYNLVQRAYRADMPSEQYYRVYDSGASVKWGAWESLTVHIKDASDPFGLVGKKVVLMGDSTYAITGKSGKRIADYLATLGGCTVYDCSFGGTRMSDSRDPSGVDSYKYFDLPRLVDAILTNDFTDQDNNLSGKAVEFTTNLATLKAVDWSSIDYLCLGFGANDFTGNVPLGDGTLDKTTYKGALVYCVNALMTTYPNLTIVCDSPRYRAWLDGDNSYAFIDDVFTHTNSLSLTTQDYVDALDNQSGKLGLPFNNNLNHYGWNRYNRNVYFPLTDGAHFNIVGTKYAAKALCSNIAKIGKSQSLT